MGRPRPRTWVVDTDSGGSLRGHGTTRTRWVGGTVTRLALLFVGRSDRGRQTDVGTLTGHLREPGPGSSTTRLPVEPVSGHVGGPATTTSWTVYGPQGRDTYVGPGSV